MLTKPVAVERLASANAGIDWLGLRGVPLDVHCVWTFRRESNRCRAHVCASPKLIFRSGWPPSKADKLLRPVDRLTPETCNLKALAKIL